MPGIRVFLYFGLVAVLPALCRPHNPCTLIQRTAICNGRQLSSVPGDLPRRTEELFLNQNVIFKLQNGCLSSYPSLRTLSCANCLLNAVDGRVFSGSPLIESLNFASNELHGDHKPLAESLGSLTRLRILDLSSNGLEEDMVSELLRNLTSLEFLDLSRNALLRLDESTFQGLRQLKELNLERNSLFEIDGAFDQLKNLRRLNLAFNSLPCLVKFDMTQLVVLNASHNLIEWFITNQDVDDTFELETLDLSDNRLLYFPFLPTYNRIKTLLLPNNHIGFYSHLSQSNSSNWTNTVEFYNLGANASNVTADLWSDDLYGDVSSVELLDLSVNQVSYFPQGFLQKMPHLSRLRMRSNCLESLNLTGEDFPVTVYEIDVSNNRLVELRARAGSASDLNNLTHLNLSANNVQKLPARLFTTFPRLGVVDLSYNPVGLCHPEEPPNSSHCAVWANLPSLKQLHVAGCQLSDIPPSAFDGTQLTHLELSDNPDLRIGRDFLSGLSGTLQHLGLSNTGLRDLNFSPFRQLSVLTVSKNSISELPETLLTLNLKVLDLRDNNLATIKPEHASVLCERAQVVYMNGNAFNCCQLEWYRTFAESEAPCVADLLELTCVHLHQRRLKAGVFDSVLCGGGSREESIFWYILLFLSVGVSMVGVSVIYFLTFRPRLLPRVIKKKCWKPTTY